MQFSTYQVQVQAERVFELARFSDGESVPRETFYALLVQGDLYNDARPNGIPIERVPSGVIATIQGAGHPDQVRIPGLADARDLYKAFQCVIAHVSQRLGRDNVNAHLTVEHIRGCLRVASVFCLGRNAHHL